MHMAAPLWAAALFLGVALLLVAAPLNADEPAAPGLLEVDRIIFEGANQISEGRLKDLMRTRSPSFWRPFSDSPYREDILDEDLRRIERYYHDEGYLNATVRLIEEPRILRGGKKVEIKIGIDEGEITRVQAIRFIGHHAISEEDLTEGVETEAGDPYSPSRVALDRERLILLYADHGRPATTVADSVSIQDLDAEVTFHIQEAPPTIVRSIAVEGAEETKHFVIRRELTFKRGDLLERKRVIESRERLFQTGFFRDVRFESSEDSLNPSSMVDITVLVRERKMGWVLAGVGYSSSKQVRLSGEVGHRNILGNAYRLVFRNRVAIDVDAILEQDQPAIEETRSELVFVEPWLFSTRNIGTVTLFGESNREPEVAAEGVEREDVLGAGVAAERRLRGRSRIRASLDNRWVTQRVRREEISGPDTLLVTGEDDFITRSLSLFVERDKRDNPFDPVTGSLGSFLGEVAGGALGGTSNFLKLSLSGSWYRPLGSMVIATRLRGGWIHPFGERTGQAAIDQVPRADRFRAGGATTVRGYPEDSLGPQAITPGQREPATERGLATVIANVELRFPVVWRFAGAVFLDAGNVWEEARDVSLGRFAPEWDNAEIEDVRYSTGAGLRFRTPIGPLRMDYGYPLTRGEPERVIDATRGGELHLSLGQAF
jgi:outer membrane protein insertion porin family